MLLHVVWDWNGTLLDDLPVVVRSVNVSLAAVGAPPIDADTYKDHYTRPVHLFYERLLGRELRPAEFSHLDDVFHGHYRSTVVEAPLSVDARQALEKVAAGGGTQSLLSMWWHDELRAATARLDVGRFMQRIDGNRGEAGETKLRHLASHLAALRRDRAVAIGDSLDDGWAARQLGIPCVLYDGGSHHRRELEALGVPVADTLLDAVDLAVGLW
jgi:phosphoglycolate phosphatase-like HAD superfamily hydrolase